MLRNCFWAMMFTLAAAFAWEREGCAIGMRVTPAGALIQGVVPGEPFELAFPLAIMNDDGEPHEVAVSAVRPSEQGMKPPPGYADIPDPSWVSFSPSEVRLPANGNGRVKVILKVPAAEEHMNQHWSVALAVRSKPAAGQMIGLALYPRFEIETASSTVQPAGWRFWKAGKRPLRALVITPAIETVEVKQLGRDSASPWVRLRAWNGSAAIWRGEVLLLSDARAAKERLGLSAGWRWLANTSWITSPPLLEIGPRSSKEILLRVTVPDEKDNYGGAWEAIVLLKGWDGASAVSRLRIKTPPPGNAAGDKAAPLR